MINKAVFILFLSVFCFSCSSSIPEATQMPGELWEGGISQVSGTITNVVIKDSNQVLTLKDKAEKEITVILSKENLGEKSFQYRPFKVGEEISFKGTLNENNIMIAIEILEMM